MKRLLVFLMTVAMLFATATLVKAQDDVARATSESQAPTEAVATGDSATAQAATPAAPAVDPNNPMAGIQQDIPLHEQIKIKFIEGGPLFMGVILVLLVLGLALVIERIIYLNLATTNTDKLLHRIEEALDGESGVEGAKDICRKTRGPLASIFYQGLSRINDGPDVVEKSINSYGSVQLQQLESGLTWISLFIALAPMFGFMGTVIGMIGAFDAIEIAGDIAPSLVAGGIKIALITTVFGLIVAATLQVFYNYILNKIDGITMSMEDATISLIDMLVRRNGSR